MGQNLFLKSRLFGPARRALTVVMIGSLVLLTACMPSVPGSGTSGGQIIFSGYGAEWEEMMRKYVIAPFEKKFNAKVVLDTQGSANEKLAKMRASKDQYTYDLAVLTASDVVAAAREGLLEKIDESKVPESKNLYEIAQTLGKGYGPVVAFDPLTLVYNKNRVSPPPDSWEALWDPKYKGRVAVSHAQEGKGNFLLILSAYMGGGDERNIDPGFQKLRTLVPNVGSWLTASAQYVPYLEREEVWLTPYWNGRAQLLKDQGLPIEIVFPNEGTIATNNIWSVPTAAKNKDLAYKFINFYLEVEQQKAWAENIYYSPTNRNVQLPPDKASRVIYGPEQIAKTRLPDEETIALERPKWIERWNKEIQEALKYAQ
jgi:putative spermidine/putrescine transport system substrate-binding protein